MKRLLLGMLLPLTTLHAAPQECLGRLTFTPPEHFEWALATSLMPMGSKAGFYNSHSSLEPDTKRYGIYPRENTWNYSTNLSIMVTPPTDGEAMKWQWRMYMPSRVDMIRQREEVESWTYALERIIKSKKEKDARMVQGEHIPVARRVSDQDIEDTRKYLEEAQAILDEMENRQIPVVKLLGIGDDAYTINYDVQRAFVRAQGRDYMFYLSNRGNRRWGLTEADTTVDQIKALLANFTPRQQGSVPHQMGYCFPYGFIKDDGKQHYEIKNSFRLTTAPNVIYSLYTGNNHMTSQGKVATYGAITKISYDKQRYERHEIDQTVNLTNGATLTLTGWRLEEKTPKNPKNPLHLYQAWGEVNGLITEPNGYLVVQLSSYKPYAEAGRPQSPMPFDKALKTLIPVLNSIKPLNSNP